MSVANILPTVGADEFFHQVALTFVPDVGAKTGRMLYEHYGSATDIFKAPLRELRSLTVIGEAKKKGIRDADNFKRTQDELQNVAKQ